MKKLTFLLTLFIFLTGNSEAQNTPKLTVGVFNNMSVNAFVNNFYWGMGALAGSQIDLRKGSISLYAMYQFSVNSSENDFFSLQSHLLGGGFQYRILSREKRFSPYIELTAMSEVGTNYRDGYMDRDGLYPISHPYFVDHGSYSYYHASFYHSTPFVGSAIVGCDIRLSNNLHLSLGVGYGLRSVKTRDKQWNQNEELTKEMLHKRPILTVWYNMLDAKLGISYAFSLKKH